jgi:antitoxin (DNA-binding transcriptional repressor) of toxin-antitoxin stability system
MKDVNVTMLRQNLPEYLAQVEAGETIRVTVHGRAIAEITQPTAVSDDAAAARARLRGSLLRYEAPLEPAIPPDEWDVNA